MFLALQAQRAGRKSVICILQSGPPPPKQIPHTALFVQQTQGWGVGMAGLDSTLRKNTRTFLTRDGGRRGCLRWGSVFGAHTHFCRLLSLLCSRQTLEHPSSCRFPACLTPWTPSAQGVGEAFRQLSERGKAGVMLSFEVEEAEAVAAATNNLIENCQA